MFFVDRLSKGIANRIIANHLKERESELEKIEGISGDLKILKELKDKLVEKDKEIASKKVEWDRTFDAIIDNIVIIGADGVVQKINKQFRQCFTKYCKIDTIVGEKWTIAKKKLGIEGDNCPVEECIESGEHQERLLHLPHGKTFYILVNPILGEDGKVISVVRVSRDITRIEEQKRKIDKRSKMFEAVAEMSKALEEHDDFGEAIRYVLEKLGNAVEAKRAYIFYNKYEQGRFCATFGDEWCEKEYALCHAESGIDSCVNYDILSGWKDGMEKGDTIKGKVTQCNLCEHKAKCIIDKNISVCAVPVFSKKEWIGFIGFDYNTESKVWSTTEETVLRIAADIIGGVLYHRNRYYNCVNKGE